MLRKWAAQATLLVAADSGADRLLEAGFSPQLTVGDLDSISAKGLQKSGEIIKIIDQSLTDCDKLLNAIRERGHTSVTLSNIEGDRLDHLLSTLSSAARSPLEVSLAIRSGIGLVLTPGKHTIDRVLGKTLSLMSLSAMQNTTIQGVRWPLSGVLLEAGIFESISNVAEAESIQISFDSGFALLTIDLSEDELPWW